MTLEDIASYSEEMSPSARSKMLNNLMDIVEETFEFNHADPEFLSAFAEFLMEWENEGFFGPKGISI